MCHRFFVDRLPNLEVSAGVLLRKTAGGVEYLLAQRPPDKVYAGCWEFPGGKLEAGESFHAALARELFEELGIVVATATPWLCREFTYPHARVFLKFFRVTGWRGEIDPREHSGIAWTRLGEPPAVAPLLPANGAILRALALSDAYVITHAAGNGVEAELERLRQALTRGVRLLQLRDKTLDADVRRRFAEKVATLVDAFVGVSWLVNDDEVLARSVGAGLHLSSARLHALARRPDFAWVAASCHTAADLAHAERLGLDFAVLGPVLPTATHPGSPGIGWGAFARLVERATIPVFALGGMKSHLLSTARCHGAHGIAFLRGW
ncbi:MAG: Nudix family hydrolase [Candidatus Accumulibacter sp.]|jgi:8-oxo-dGTP diphosphatase|nr:Nudix family hydrolase [Accumulibacter sp.]